ncbi:Sec39-domain-containing protein [Hymenopellis radicata]|nr:Sec39-domain-containing protein [Hymenopellis radicata]
MASPSYTPWLSLADSELTVENVHEHLDALQDDLWVAAACHDRLVDDVEVQQALLNIGLQRTSQAVQRCKDALNLPSADCESPESLQLDAAVAYFQDLPIDAQLCRLHGLLLGRQHRLVTYVEMCKDIPDDFGDSADEDAEWEDDPWAESSGGQRASKEALNFPVTLSAFLTSDLLQSACYIAIQALFPSLRVLLDRHGADLWPYRFTIYDSFPAHVDPSQYRDFLPRVSPTEDAELPPSWRHAKLEVDPSHILIINASADALGIVPSVYSASSAQDACLTSGELSAWYIRRVETIMLSTGIMDFALAVIQHGASQGVPELDELGEDLSLLTRLVYDAPGAGDADEEWTMERWKSMEPATIVRAYTAHSTAESLPNDILHLVMPYLYVLESRAERSGNPNPRLHTDLLYDFILTAPLEHVASIFEASKPTSSASQRVIKDDEDMARLALACLYGSNSLDEWPTMSRIFEYLMIFFKPLPISSLSRALDILDVHLESGEILSRWSVPAPFSWFLQSRNNVSEQRAWANRMARRAGGSNDELTTLEDWEWLLEDMLKLAGKGDSELRGAFGLLSVNEVIRIFFSGLLSTARFDVANIMLRQNRHVSSLTPQTIEEICLTSSREFYDNANSGNYKVGDMKSAYDCLEVPALSEQIAKEREFIEATSRLSSFNVMSRPGIPISPIEIRLTKDRLSLVSRLLVSNYDAYKHAEVILDLVYMLGFRGDVVAEVKTLAMLADAALQSEDFDRAYATSERMVKTVLDMRHTNISDQKVKEASEVCWVACYQLGRHPEFEAIDQKMVLLGRSLELCPPEQLHEVLSAWSRLEKEDIDLRETRLMEREALGGRVVPQKRAAAVMSGESRQPSLRSRLADFHLPATPLLNTPDAAALASKTFKSVAANFPFSRGRPMSDWGSESNRSDSRTRDGDSDVSAQATRVFSKGIGWLLGADEEQT